jgi:hypothetical protein
MENIKTINYNLGSATQAISNIFQDLDIEVFNDIFSEYLTDYTVVDGEFPEKIANGVYGDTKYTYVLFYVNNISSMANDWPLDSLSFKTYIKKKYGSVEYAKSNVKSYFDLDYEEITEYDAQNLPDISYYTVTYWDYEEELNNLKAQIKIIDPLKIEVLMSQIRNYKRTGKYEL